MKCSKILDTVYEYSGEESIPLLLHIQVALHTLFCQNCAREINRFYLCRNILREDFLPPSPGLEDSIMARIAALGELQEAEETFEIPGGLTTRGWIITGFVILVSLVTAFFGLEFNNIAGEAGKSFMLPMGITIGIVLTSYGALFIGSHLKELSERFGL
ncbi:MAG: peptidoglycan-binding protein [Treponema sp.]|nr:peptidoglycan-binding protein [Treponema sp.]